MKSLYVEDFSLEHTINCAQFFCFEKINDFYYIIHRDLVFKVKQIGNELYYDGINEKELNYFFSLDLDLKKMVKEFKDEYSLLALEKYYGLRLIRQDLWQCLIGFVCSSASNVNKIKMNLKLLSKEFGKRVEFDGHVFYTFPEIGSLNDLEIIKDCKTGYRAKFLFEINKSVNYESLEKIKNRNYLQAKNELIKLSGIGSKVADCICLFSLEHIEAFPIDTWIKQIIEKYYLKRKASIKEIEEYIKENFYGNVGLQQQYLFQYIRNLK